MFSKICVVLLLINLCCASMYLDMTASHPDYPGKCFDKTDKHVFSPGEEYRPIGRCFTLICNQPGQVTGMSCGAVYIQGCKKIDRDMKKPHPQCCDRFLCQDENGKDFIYNPAMNL